VQCRQISTWPDILSLELTGPTVPITQLQLWIKDTKPATAVLEPVSRTDDNFGQLLKLLRETRCVGFWCLCRNISLTHYQYATASWKIEGKGYSTANILLAPFARALLCAAFPASGVPYLPTSRLQQEKPTVHRRGAKSRVPHSQQQLLHKPQRETGSWGHTYSNRSRGSAEYAHTGLSPMSMTLRPRRPCKQLNARLHNLSDQRRIAYGH
jgi:hypothetical protein